MSEKRPNTIEQKKNVRHLSEFTENILIVDDEQRHLNSLRELMADNGFNVELAHNGEEAINRIKTKTIGLLLLDLNMPDMSGNEVMDFIKTNKINTTVIVVSGESSFEAANSALKHGAYDYIKKPYTTEALINSVKNALKKRQLEHDNLQMQAKLLESEKLHRYLVNKSPDIVYMLDTNGRFTFVNKRIETLLGYQKEDLLGKHYTSIIHEDDHEKAKHTFNERRTGERATTNVELRFRCKNNDCAPRHFETSIIPIEISAVGIYNTKNDLPNNKFLGTYGIARDITERVEAEEIIRFQAYHDMLTRLPNRTLLKDRLNQAISHSRRNHSKLAVMFLDLDRFKVVNDTLGHLIGDQLLQSVSVRLKKCLREGDTLARIGGDEFTLLLPEIHGPKCSEMVAEKIISSLEHPFNINGHEFFVSTSIGIAHYPDDGSTMETLIKHADIAMYSVKGNGKNGYRFYADHMNEVYSNHMSLETDMRRALSQGQFKISYQPQINIETGEVFAMEALIRWDHPERGSISPYEFISLAEETGLILPIGEWVLRNACAELKRWREAGLSNIRIAINISACQLEQDHIVKTIIDILHENNIPGEMLEIEITENVIMKDIENGINKLTQLSNHGINIAIDDFGTGYSSLSYLKRLPIDTLKIDRSFVHDMQNSDEDASIIKAIIAMARGLGLNIISEGVETKEQLELLKAWRCKNMQGFLFSRPIKQNDAINFLKSSAENTAIMFEKCNTSAEL
ncbi:MAG: EAL domain-containing protein [Gammaproteobacteria bacterium]|nr:EAL domain-containing protein [Gammaproteobacteria bacterium]MDH5734557.1 EAL domain-containing protein [Gammaproteobacteria bacterium]